MAASGGIFKQKNSSALTPTAGEKAAHRQSFRVTTIKMSTLVALTGLIGSKSWLRSYLA